MKNLDSVLKIFSFKVHHHQNELMVIFPNVYHSGFNTGLNVAEAVNFFHPSWVPFGRKSINCPKECGFLKIDYDRLVKKYDRSNYANWVLSLQK
jgi:hypothetical protein